MVETSDYLHLNKEIDSANLFKLLVPCAEIKLRNEPCKMILVEAYYILIMKPI